MKLCSNPSLPVTCMTRASAALRDGTPSPLCSHVSQVDTWIIMEYCNRGSLQTAVPKGMFQRVDSDGTTRPNRLNILTTAVQLAEAMAYVHSQVLEDHFASSARHRSC